MSPILTGAELTGLHPAAWICERAAHEDCFCGARPDQPCDCGPGCMHLGRYARAKTAGHISYRDLASVIPGDDASGATVIPNPAAGAA